MKSRHCEEGSNHITFMDSDYKIASFLAMTDYSPSLNQTIHPPFAIVRFFLRLLDILVPATYGSSADCISF
ncbi:hypothetical protein ACFPVY_01035 [Flavobacterium qiangtangense]|uniref:Uncharacterized protein n=1 Tax=Flavobacterium qiangtangense TaxID=1442595 RepID=A0ABW1PJR6_9FLAO